MMEMYLKVLEKLEVSDKNSLKYSHFEYPIPNNEKILKLYFSSNSGNEKIILVKVSKKYNSRVIQNYEDFKNVVKPAFFIDHIGISYAVFEEKSVKNYHFKESLDVDHIELVLETMAKFHGNFLAKASRAIDKGYFINFRKYIENCVQKIETNLNGEKTGFNLQLLKQQIDKILETLATTLDNNQWVPSLGSFDTNILFFKHDFNGKPIDYKILILDSDKYVPPVYDILNFLFAQTNDDNRKEYLRELLQFYCSRMENNLGIKEFDSEQINFQIRSFIPLIKLTKLVFYDSADIRYIRNLNHVAEFLPCPSLIREECYEILLNYLGHGDYSLQKFSLVPLEERGGNLGDYFKLKMQVVIEHENIEINLFVKFLPSNNKSTNDIVKGGPSRKENFFFNFLVEEFEKCGLKKYLDCIPRCFLSKVNYVLVLEDLGLQGYQTYTDLNGFTYDMLSLTIKKLAQLHACSLVFEEIKSKELQREFRLDEYYGDYLQEILFQTKEDNELKFIAEVGEKCITDYLIFLYPEVVRNMTMEEFQRRSKLTLKNFYMKHLKSNIYRNTLCHGDTWAANIMYKFDSSNALVDCKLVDFQLTRYCPPAQDVLSFIYLTTTRDIRTKYLSILLEEYYKELSKIITSFGFDLEKVISREEFQKSCHYMKSQAVCQALFYGPTNFANTEDRVSVFNDPEKFEKIIRNDRRPFIEEMMKKYPFYRARIGGLVQDLYDICESKQY